MIDHMSLHCSNWEKTHTFYTEALNPIGYEKIIEIPKEYTGGAVVVGMGAGGKADFWIEEGTPNKPALHVAFTADNRDQVDAFYEKALAAGGKDNGAPGPRPHYHKDYYGAFVLDPDGHNIEVVCHKPG